MVLRSVLIPVILALGVLFLGAATAADRVERSVNEQGTIRISNAPPASQEKTGGVKVPPGVAAPEGPPPGLLPSGSQRPYGPEAEARRKAILEMRQSLQTAPEAPAPPAHPELPPPAPSPQN